MPLPDQPTVLRLRRACPAKINLRLAVLGRRNDGYHNLSSIVAPISLYDHLDLEWQAGPGDDLLEMPGSELSCGADNLVLRAVCAFREARDFPGHLKIVLQKSIPSGAGLGGGSSDAAGTLLALQSIWGYPLTPAELQQIAGKLGADVPFFLHPQTALMQGTGDVLTPAPHLHTRLARRKFLVFKPSFGISTVWAYEALAKEAAYQSDKEEDRFLADIVAAKKTLDELPFNAFRSIVDQRYPTIPVLLNTLNEQAEARAEMSGSGSACFAMYRSDDQSEAIQAHVRDAWGAEVFLEAVGIV